MVTTLNKKQTELLQAMSHENLLGIIDDLIKNNKQARAALVNGYLLSPADSLKNIEKEYNKRARSTRFLHSYEADEFYDDLRINVAGLFDRVIPFLPEKAETLIVKMLSDIDRLSETKDTSSGVWMDYYAALTDAWMKSLGEQKDGDMTAIAERIFLFCVKDHIDTRFFCKYKSVLGIPLLRVLRDLFYKNKKIHEALNISFIIKDVDFFADVMNQGSFSHPQHWLDYAQLLTDEVRANEAVTVLMQADQKRIKHHGLEFRWHEQLIIALTEEGKSEEARERCIEAFKILPQAEFYRLYHRTIKESAESTKLFLDIAMERGEHYYLSFLTDTGQVSLINEYILALLAEKKEEMLEIFSGSFIRSTSSTLYKHGFALAATLLRRYLVERVLQTAQSRYYNHAASDLKKSIDYSAELEDDTGLMSTRAYLVSLYEKHKRKVSLWPLLEEKIKGVSVKKEGIRYEGIAL